jgi:hypothetical protein
VGQQDFLLLAPSRLRGKKKAARVMQAASSISEIGLVFARLDDIVLRRRSAIHCAGRG